MRTELRPEVIHEMETLHQESRRDAVAYLCRRLYLRVSCCPCLHRPKCVQCEIDEQEIQEAWDKPVVVQ